MRYVRKKQRGKYSDISIDDAVAKSLAYIKDELKVDEEYSNEELDALLEDLSYSASEFIERSFKVFNEGDPKNNSINKDGILGMCKGFLEFSNKKEKSDNVLLGYNDLEIPTTETAQKSEIYANIMYLSNVMAHILKENRTNRESNRNLRAEGLEINKSINDMFALKDRCIRELIKCKEQGEKLEIFFRVDEHGRTTFTAVIPDYFEPFSMHINENTGLDDETISKYQPTYINMPVGYRPTYPFKVTDAKKELFDYIYENREDKDLKRVKPRLEWFYDAQDRIKQLKTQFIINADPDKSQIIEEILELQEMLDEQNIERKALTIDKANLIKEKQNIKIQINEIEKNNKEEQLER